MALERLFLIFIYIFSSQVLTSAQYVQYAGTPVPIPAYVTSYPVQGYASPSPVYQSYQPNYPAVSYKAPAVGTSYAQTSSVPVNTPSPIYQPSSSQTTPIHQPIRATPIVAPTIAEPKIPVQSVPVPIKPCVKEALEKVSPKDLLPTSPPFDSNVLNNLAIALQLLIVSNLIHNPPPDPISSQVPEEDVFPAIAPLPIAYVPPSVSEFSVSPSHIPNANFIGTSNFGDAGITKSMMTGFGSPTLPVSRPMGLMSPYDAIGPNSPYFEAFQAKPEPKSPYLLASDYKDLFSLSELFKI